MGGQPHSGNQAQLRAIDQQLRAVSGLLFFLSVFPLTASSPTLLTQPRNWLPSPTRPSTPSSRLPTSAWVVGRLKTPLSGPSSAGSGLAVVNRIADACHWPPATCTTMMMEPITTTNQRSHDHTPLSSTTRNFNVNNYTNRCRDIHRTAFNSPCPTVKFLHPLRSTSRQPKSKFSIHIAAAAFFFFFHFSLFQS